MTQRSPHGSHASATAEGIVTDDPVSGSCADGKSPDAGEITCGHGAGRCISQAQTYVRLVPELDKRSYYGVFRLFLTGLAELREALLPGIQAAR
jgi:hypothetical protein